MDVAGQSVIEATEVAAEVISNDLKCTEAIPFFNCVEVLSSTLEQVVVMRRALFAFHEDRLQMVQHRQKLLELVAGILAPWADLDWLASDSQNRTLRFLIHELPGEACERAKNRWVGAASACLDDLRRCQREVRLLFQARHGIVDYYTVPFWGFLVFYASRLH